MVDATHAPIFQPYTMDSDRAVWALVWNDARCCWDVASRFAQISVSCAENVSPETQMRHAAEVCVALNRIYGATPTLDHERQGE